MDINIHASFLPHNDPDASLAFYRDLLGFEVRNDVGYKGMRWITVGPVDQPGTSIVLHPPGADPGITADERRTITEMMAKGTYAGILLATRDLDATFERLQASGAEVVQEPTEQQILPVPVQAGSGDVAAGASAAVEYEPDEEQILSELLPRNLAVQVYGALLENAASEQGARMAAMDSATRNAGEMINKLTLSYNRQRQAMITKELMEIISGAEAV